MTDALPRTMIYDFMSGVCALVDGFVSGYSRLDRILDAIGFDFEYDRERGETVRKRGPHTITADDSTASYTGPFGDRYDMSFKDMTRFLRDPRG